MLFVALLLEAGLLLLLIPWSAFWDRNYFAEAIPGVRELITNNFVRGAVSGLGVVNLFAAVSELADIFTRPAPRLGPGSASASLGSIGTSEGGSSTDLGSGPGDTRPS